MSAYYAYNLRSVCLCLNTCSASDLFWFASKMSQVYGLNWYYTNKSLYEFINDWCDNGSKIKIGDKITVKTIDGKYECEYVICDIWITRMEVETESHGFLKIERISKVNGKESNFINGWRLKKEVSNTRKI